MADSPMEEAIRTLVQQVTGISQILPTLATKADLERFATKDDLRPFATKDDLRPFATKDDLRPFATKDDLRPFATKDDLRPFATKDDLEAMWARAEARFATKEDLDAIWARAEARFATKDDLREGLEDVKRHSLVLYESLRDDIRMIAEALTVYSQKADATAAGLASLVERLQRKGVI